MNRFQGESTRTVDAEPRHLLALQARPIDTVTIPFPIAGHTVTTIVRHWRPGDTARCRLCSMCSAKNDSCIVVVGKAVSTTDAAFLSTTSMTRVRSEGGSR